MPKDLIMYYKRIFPETTLMLSCLARSKCSFLISSATMINYKNLNDINLNFYKISKRKKVL